MLHHVLSDFPYWNLMKSFVIKLFNCFSKLKKKKFLTYFLIIIFVLTGWDFPGDKHKLINKELHIPATFLIVWSIYVLTKFCQKSFCPRNFDLKCRKTGLIETYRVSWMFLVPNTQFIKYTLKLMKCA
jgi:hypothetical protein